MPEHFLHGPEVRASLNKMRRKTVPERVRADGLLQTNSLSEIFNDGEDHHPGQLSSVAVQKDKRFIAFGRSLVRTLSSYLFEVYFKIAKGGFSNRHEALLVSFPGHTQETAVAINVVDLEIHQFRNAQPGAV